MTPIVPLCIQGVCRGTPLNHADTAAKWRQPKGTVMLQFAMHQGFRSIGTIWLPSHVMHSIALQESCERHEKIGEGFMLPAIIPFMIPISQGLRAATAKCEV